MSKPIEWHPGDACPNCGRDTMLKIPRPPADRVKASKDAMYGTPVPQRYDTAPDDVIDELGDLYRCDPCDCKVRVKVKHDEAAPAAAQ